MGQYIAAVGNSVQPQGYEIIYTYRNHRGEFVQAYPTRTDSSHREMYNNQYAKPRSAHSTRCKYYHAYP